MNQISKFGIFALLLSSSLTIMVGTVIAPSLKEISVHLGFEENPGLLITLPSLGVVIFAPFVGKLIDRKGAYLMLRWGLILYALLGLLGGASYQPLFGCDRSYSFRCCYGVNTGSWNRLNCTIIHW